MPADRAEEIGRKLAALYISHGPWTFASVQWSQARNLARSGSRILHCKWLLQRSRQAARDSLHGIGDGLHRSLEAAKREGEGVEDGDDQDEELIAER